MQVTFNDTLCDVYFEKYSNNDRNAITLFDAHTQEPFMTASTNINGLYVKDTEVLIKNYSENEGILDVLTQAKIVLPLELVLPGVMKCLLLKPEQDSMEKELDKDYLNFYKESSRINEHLGIGGPYLVHKLDFAVMVHSTTQFILVKKENEVYERFLTCVTENQEFKDNASGIPTALIHREPSSTDEFFMCAIKADIAVDYREIKEDWFWYTKKK